MLEGGRNADFDPRPLAVYPLVVHLDQPCHESRKVAHRGFVREQAHMALPWVALYCGRIPPRAHIQAEAVHRAVPAGCVH